MKENDGFWGDDFGRKSVGNGRFRFGLVEGDAHGGALPYYRIFHEELTLVVLFNDAASEG